MRVFAVFGLVGGMIFGPLAAAQPMAAAPGATGQGGPAESVTPAKQALVRRYLAAIQYEKLMDQTMAAMLPVMVDSMARQHPDMTPEERRVILDVVREVMRDEFTPKVMERMTPIYARTFTEPELQAIVTFYESPAGRAVTAKVQTLGPQAADVVRSLMPEAQAEAARRACERLQCDAASAPKGRPS